jgi:hypothetical protein
MVCMMKEFKNMKKNPSQNRERELWCTDCKDDGHTKGSCPKNQFCDIYQIVGHSTKECSFNMKTKGHQQVLLTQEVSNSRATGTNNNTATSGGYLNNNRCRRGGNNNNNNNNNEGCSRIQYDPIGWPMIQCRVCNLLGHFARDCTTKGTPQLLCRWCGPRDHDDLKYPKLGLGVNLLTIERCEKETLVITCAQAKKATYQIRRRRRKGCSRQKQK